MVVPPSAGSLVGRERWLLLLVVCATGLLRASLLGTALWEDEALRYDIAVGQSSHQAGGVRADLHTVSPELEPLGTLRQTLGWCRSGSPYGPVQFVLLHGLMWLGVRSVGGLQAVNLCAAMVSAAVLYLLARRGLRPVFAALASLLFAASAWDIGVGMQLKETALATMAGVVTLLALVRAVEVPSRARWLLYGVAFGGALNTQVHALLWVPIHVALLLTVEPRPWRWATSLLVGWGATLGCALPWLLYAGRAQAAYLAEVNADMRGQWSGLTELPSLLHRWFSQTVAPLGPELFERSGWFEAALLLGVGALGLGLRGRWAEAGPHRSFAGKRSVASLGAVVWVGIVALSCALYVLRHQNQALWPRYATAFMPGLWLLLAAASDGAVTWLKSRWAPLRRGLTVAVVVGVTGFAVSWGPPARAVAIDRYINWHTVTSTLATRAVTDDVVVHQPGAAAFDAFIHDWPLQTRHTVPAASSDAKAKVFTAAGDHAVWVVLSWGEARDAAAWREAASLAGWGLREGFSVVSAGATTPSPEESRSANGVLVLGFSPLPRLID